MSVFVPLTFTEWSNRNNKKIKCLIFQHFQLQCNSIYSAYFFVCYVWKIKFNFPSKSFFLCFFIFSINSTSLNLHTLFSMVVFTPYPSSLFHGIMHAVNFIFYFFVTLFCIHNFTRFFVMNFTSTTTTQHSVSKAVKGAELCRVKIISFKFFFISN